MILYRTPGRSFTRPPRTSTMECSCRLWPTPGMSAVASMPLVKRTRATLRRAEFGFLGVVVPTRVHTPRRCGAPLSAGVLVLSCFCSRPFRTSCAMVGNACLSIDTATANTAKGNCSEERVARRATAPAANEPYYGLPPRRGKRCRAGPALCPLSSIAMADLGDHAYSLALTVLGHEGAATDIAFVAVRRGGRSRVAVLAFARHLSLVRARDAEAPAA